MTPAEFVSCLRVAVFEENVGIYRQLFNGTSVANASDPYWKSALALFNGLSSEQQEVFFQVVRQVATDTTANVLGVIDGVNALNGVDEQLVLSCESGVKLSGDLQSLFLVEEERTSRA
ncbi:hypothetical protein YS110_04315 [Acidovorax sp. YS12]|nr:hypothetical protein YS110_04315 [Acidovorax sp. YS12]